MEKILFSTNWNNKLSCKAFTTVRLESKKYKRGNKYEIFQQKELKGIAQLVQLVPFKLDKVSESLARIDTGYSKEEFKALIRKMYPNIDFSVKNLVHLTLVYIK